MRADELLVLQSLTKSRSLAKNLIKEGKILIGSTKVLKPSQKVPENTQFTIIDAPRYVSRAGDKLKAFIDQYNISCTDKRCIDIGASTGGFTDCLFQYGASHVTCVDVGHDQLHPKVKDNPKVTNLEKTNAKTITPEILPHSTYDMIVMDVSFISITKILPVIWTLMHPDSILIALIKPQFEADKAIMDACKGIIKDESTREGIKESVIHFCLKNLEKSNLVGTMDSPILGGDGNKEYLMGLRYSHLA